MAETQSKTQLPIELHNQEAAREEAAQACQRGLDAGREYAQQAMRRVAAWAEENPGQLLLAGLLAGFILGKLLFRPRKVVVAD